MHWFTRLRWSSAATWPTGQYSNCQCDKNICRAICAIILNWYVMRVFFLSISSQPSPPPAKKPKKKATTILGCWLPWWFVFVGWFLLLSISGISTFFTLLYGFQYGKEKSIKWVMSLGLSLFESIFILQPLKVGKINPFFFKVNSLG